MKIRNIRADLCAKIFKQSPRESLLRKNIVCLFIFFLSLPIYAQNPEAEIDQYIEKFREAQKIPGIAVLVVKDGQTVKAQGYGLANVEHNVPVKPETIFQSGSIGKQFTSAGILLLEREGKLNTQDPVSKYLKAPKSWEKMTIYHLLTHTSGLGDYPEEFDFRKDYTEDELFEIVTKQKLKSIPGEKWSYSNLGYLTLGVLIHKVSGKFYGDYLQEKLFQPLGMTATRVISENDIIPNRAAGYRLVDDELKNQEWVSPTLNTTADGALYFNILDLAKWDAALAGNEFLAEEIKTRMWSPVKLNGGTTYDYGFGWGVRKRKGHRSIEHGGAWQGFSTHIARFPDDRLSVVVLTNLSGADAGYLSYAIAGLYAPDLAPARHTETTLQREFLKKFEGKYMLDEAELQVKNEGNRLICKAGSRKMELIPESENLFFLEYSELTIAPKFDSKGKVSHLVLKTFGGDREARRVE